VTPPFDSSALSSAEKDALIARLLARIDELSKRLAAVEAENAALRDTLNLPPKTPDNSSTPPSQGRKASSEPARKSARGRRGINHSPGCNSFRRDQGATTAASGLPARSAVVGVHQARQARRALHGEPLASRRDRRGGLGSGISITVPIR
jgi:hypothetical protein